MHVRVRLFARQRELVGARLLDIELPDGCSVGDAWAVLVARHPALAPASSSVRFARNRSYAGADEPLADGDELACIPPVSGGSKADDPADDRAEHGADGGAEHEADRLVRVVRITADAIDEGVLRGLEASVATPADGAVVLFVGRTRESPGTPAPGEEQVAAGYAGSKVEALDYEAYDEMAIEVVETIAAEIEARFGVRRLAVVHRVGTVPLGDASVAIAVAAPHREAAFDACRYAIDELKARAPIWKSERFVDGSVWVGAPARAAAIEDPEQG